MLFFELAEPEQSLNPHEKKYVVGIDLGTTNSLVARISHSVPDILVDLETQNTLVPSVVHFSEEGIEVGYWDSKKISQNNSNIQTFSSVKRLFGLENQIFQTAQGIQTPITISAEILKTLKNRALQAMPQLDGAVITVPAYFDDVQRQQTQQAAQLAGIEVLRLLNEPTAAAIAYGLDDTKRGTFAVYDLGGGTFDVSILELSDGVFEVLATGGDSYLGGDDFDDVLQNMIQNTLSNPLSNPLSKPEIQHLKKNLSPKQTIEFEEKSKFLVDKTLAIFNDVCKQAGQKVNQLDGILLVGGSTRMPMIKKALQQYNITIFDHLNPDEVVVMGAARQAHQLAYPDLNNEHDFLLLDVCPLSLGIETMGGLVEKIIPRNSIIPISKAQEFTTYQDGQTAMKIHVLQGERELVEDCRSLGSFSLKGIPSMVAGMPKIRVLFQLDANGILTVSATELTTNIQAEVVFHPKLGLSDEQTREMLETAFSQAQGDMQKRKDAEFYFEAQHLCTSTLQSLEKLAETSLQAKNEFLSSQSGRQLIQALELVQEEIEQSELQLQSYEHLVKCSDELAQIIMNEGIKKYLVGKNIDEIETSL